MRVPLDAEEVTVSVDDDAWGKRPGGVARGASPRRRRSAALQGSTLRVTKDAAT
ncbi:MAG: hypothetical protein JNN01_23345 [Opitutaceae bacterium]|nr:hypothetical protein [Opitutaceae bacterium]